MKEKRKEEKDKEVKEAINFVAERFAYIFWKHWLWLQKEKRNKTKKKDS